MKYDPFRVVLVAVARKWGDPENGGARPYYLTPKNGGTRPYYLTPHAKKFGGPEWGNRPYSRPPKMGVPTPNG